MNLTPEQEAAMLAKYEGFIRNVVNGICSRSTRTHQNEFEDLMQEARIAFLLHLRKAEDISEAHNCGKDILSALWSYWRSMAVVHISKGSYKNEISNVHRIPWEASLDETLCTADNETEFPALLHDFLSGQTEEDQKIISLKQQGYSNNEIIPMIHLNDKWQMSRRLNRVRQKAVAYFAQ